MAQKINDSYGTNNRYLVRKCEDINILCLNINMQIKKSVIEIYISWYYISDGEYLNEIY